MARAVSRGYDVVVVGAGGSGAPLAARLSEDPDRRVLLLEAGPAPLRQADYPRELLDATTVQGAMPGHPNNWSYLGHLTPDLPYTIARGRILGGSTALNGAYFVRPARADFTAWAAVAGPEWSFEAVLPTMRRMEADADATLGIVDADVHGLSGPMVVSRPPQTGRLPSAFTAAARGAGFPDEADKNAPGIPGVGAVPLNVRHGVRWNTGLAYVLPALARPNLTVRGGARVIRLVIRDGRATGVELVGGERVAADEVILSAGAIATPQLLMLSGIGPARHLTELGIPIVIDLPVGAAFSDHPDIGVGWRSRGPVVDPREKFAFPTALNLSSDGGPVQGDLEILLSVKSLGYLLTGSTRFLTTSAAAVLRHPVAVARAMRGASARRAASQLAHRDDLQLIVALQQPEARGRISLTSADPLRQPRIDYHHLSTSSDLARMRTGVRTAATLLRAPSFAGLFGNLTELTDDTLARDSDLNAWMLTHLGTAIHLCGSAPMGRAGDGTSVTDAHGRVHGVPGLRVADTSILPWVPSRGPAAAAVLIGERVAEFMRGRE